MPKETLHVQMSFAEGSLPPDLAAGTSSVQQAFPLRIPRICSHQSAIRFGIIQIVSGAV